LYAKTGKEFSADICKQKYEYYLLNESNNEGWSSEEEDRLFNLQKVLGNKWTTIAAKLGGK
jgi:myb-like DNA-binding domain